MEFLFLGLVGVAVWVVTLVTRIKRLEISLQHLLTGSRDEVKASDVRGLASRVSKLEAATRQDAPGAARRPPPGVALPATPAPPHVAAPPGAGVPPVAGPPLVAVPPRAAAPPAAAPSRVGPPPGVPAAPVPVPPPTGQEEAWEVTVGGSWLNKIGVLVFVIGLALLVGYSMTHVGPAGRIAIGFAISLAMLAGGVVMERRPDYRNYAHGLIAGGWAGTYFTTYAMRAVDAARILDSDVMALALLLAVACAMVWHSLRYRSRDVTALAFVVAFATLALTPLHGFALVASVPLAVSVLVVAQRFEWPGVQVLGIVCTYGLYVLRGSTFGFGDLDLTTFTPYAALAVYWIVFEAADIAAITRRTEGSPLPPPLFLLNAAGLVGAALLQLPVETPVPLSTFLVLSGTAYLGSAVIRARLTGQSPAGNDALDAAARGSYQGASGLAAALVAWAIELRFGGTQRTLALLMEAELLFLSGLLLRDWLIRGLGSAVAILATLHSIDALAVPVAATPEWTWQAQAAIGIAGLTAALWYGNREALRSRSIRPLLHEWIYTPLATYLVLLIVRSDLRSGYTAFASFVFGWLLLEAGLRRGREYRYQAYVVGPTSALVLAGWFVSHEFLAGVPTVSDAWWILAPAAAVAYVAAWRVMPEGDSSAGDDRERLVAAGVAGTIGTLFIIVLEWMVISPDYVGMVWAATAAAIGGVGWWRDVSGLRWQLYPLLALALLRVVEPIFGPDAATTVQIASSLVVVGLMYAASLAVRKSIAASPSAEAEDAARIVLSIAASLALAGVIHSEVRPTLITLTWGLQAGALLVIGFPARERLMRLSGLAVLVACILRLFTFDLPQLEELARIVSFVALGAGLLAVSWVYTRYRDKIQKYL